jgi:hypothetical protein
MLYHYHRQRTCALGRWSRGSVLPSQTIWSLAGVLLLVAVTVDSVAVVLVCSCPKISGSPVMGWLDPGRQVSSPLQPDLPRSRGHLVLLQVPSLVSYCASWPPSAGVSVGSISSPATFAMSLGVAPRSSRTLPRDAHTVLLPCHNLRLYIRACSLRGCLRIRSTWGLQCTGRSGLSHSSACKYRLILVASKGQSLC